ncbi:hypothetical protein Nepgr_032322 [Nepenthes gracilis]|uniref:Uncharacterized protein n=1 Tax=Nepenthes gracilis TaxID=150966 RepID=A0AAD3Y7T0_NEPGR|nr:hypothetical protein Nepgr_032322 [Nepenthes gracilis]
MACWGDSVSLFSLRLSKGSMANGKTYFLKGLQNHDELILTPCFTLLTFTWIHFLPHPAAIPDDVSSTIVASPTWLM